MIHPEIEGMRAVPDGAVEPWVTRLQPPHPPQVLRAVAALTTVTRDRRAALMAAYTLADAGLLAEETKAAERSAEYAFLAARVVAQHQRTRPRCYGISSDALALYALGLVRRPQVPGTPTREGGHSWFGSECGSDYPFDLDDLAACQRTFDMAPPHLQERMRPVLDEFTGWIRERRNRHGEVIV